jgi:hypothetical protein
MQWLGWAVIVAAKSFRIGLTYVINAQVCQFCSTELHFLHNYSFNLIYHFKSK